MIDDGPQAYERDKERVVGLGAKLSEIRQNHAQLIEGICNRCSNGVVYRRKMPAGAPPAEPVVYCKALHRDVPPDIEVCSHFWAEGQLSLHQMYDMALHVDGRKESGGQYL